MNMLTQEQLTKYRKLYWEELVKFCEGYPIGPPPTYSDLQYLLSQISDATIIDDVQCGRPPLRTIESLMYYETQTPLPRQHG